MNKKLWMYIPRSRMWMERWLERAVADTDLGLTKRGEPRARTTSLWLWRLIEAALAERYYPVRKQIVADGEDVPDIEDFLQEGK